MYAMPFCLAWLAIFLELISTTEARKYMFLVGSPLCLIVSVGIYAFVSVTWGLWSFNDCAEARSELLEEIHEAKIDLRKRKIL